MATKPGKLTLGLLLGKGAPEDPTDEGDEEMSESEVLPPGLLEAVSEFRAATTDEEAAKSLHRAILCCGED